MNDSARGFTLMELIMTVALAAVILGLGVPAFRDFALNGRLTGAANEMLITIVAARNEAMRAHTNVSVCPSADPSSAAASCAAGATQGFIAFADTNGNCVRDGLETLAANFEVHSNVDSDRNATCISFAPTGFRRVIAGQPTTARTMFCDSRGIALVPGSVDTSYGRGVEVLPTGRAYVSRSHVELTGWAGGADPVSCP